MTEKFFLSFSESFLTDHFVIYFLADQQNEFFGRNPSLHYFAFLC